MTELDTSQYTPADKTTTEEKKEETEYDKVDAEQVQDFLNRLEYVITHSKDEELIEKAMNVMDDIKENGNAEENMILKKYQCRKCKKVFPTTRSYKGHYHGKPGCGGTPRWMSDYETWEEQLNTIKI